MSRQPLISREEFARVLEYLSSAYPRVEMKVRTLDVYYDQLQIYTRSQLITAARKHVANHTWFPTVAEIRAYISAPPSPMLSLPPAKRMGAEEAAAAVRRIMDGLTGKKP